MAIPNLQPFDELLRSVRFHEPAESGYEVFELLPERNLNDGRPLRTQAASVWYRSVGELTMDSIIDRLGKELRTRGHDFDSATARAFLAVSFFTDQLGRSPTETLNHLIDHIGSVQVTDHLITMFPPYPGTRRYNIGEFAIGAIDRERIEYWCRKVGCDFFDRYPRQFINRFGIERAPSALNALRVIDLQIRPRAEGTLTSAQVLDYYFERLTERRRQRFAEDLDEAQAVPVAAGAPYIDLETPNVWFGSTFVSIYSGLGRNRGGYFCPLGTSAHVDFASADRRFPAVTTRLREDYGFEKLDSSAIHNALSLFCRFVVRAKRFADDGKVADALLYNVIALELLLGERNAMSRSVVQRATVIAAPALGQPYTDLSRLIAEAYDARSAYVHAGDPVKERALRNIEPVVSQVLYCLLRFQARAANRAAGARDRWLKLLDLLAASEEASDRLAETKFAEAGIAPERGDNQRIRTDTR